MKSLNKIPIAHAKLLLCLPMLFAALGANATEWGRETGVLDETGEKVGRLTVDSEVFDGPPFGGGMSPHGRFTLIIDCIYQKPVSIVVNWKDFLNPSRQTRSLGWPRRLAIQIDELELEFVMAHIGESFSMTIVIDSGGLLTRLLEARRLVVKTMNLRGVLEARFPVEGLAAAYDDTCGWHQESGVSPEEQEKRLRDIAEAQIHPEFVNLLEAASSGDLNKVRAAAETIQQIRATYILDPSVPDKMRRGLDLDIRVSHEYLKNNFWEVTSWSRAQNTPLMEAAANGHIEVVRYLVDQGAKPNYTNVYRKTAADLARESGHHDVVEFLKQQER